VGREKDSRPGFACFNSLLVAANRAAMMTKPKSASIRPKKLQVRYPPKIYSGSPAD